MENEAKAARNAYQRDYMKKYRQNDPEYLKRYQRDWRRANPEKVKRYNAEYWERKANSESLETKVVRLRDQGYSLRDIGSLLNISKSTVSRILRRGT